ncbi:MAG: hypothetical protein K9G13_04010 [Aquiluna sp.]|nr:hypothetical protein [Aquiluna sp.]MCF8545685.1 hypothetical protein [Aquiluna sp.]
MFGDVGLWLTGLWFLVLFVGGITAGQTKSDLIKGIAIGALITIPVTYLVMFLIS